MYSTSNCLKDTKSSDLCSLVIKIPSRTKWNQFGCVLLGLPNYLLWNVLILLTAVLNYIFVTTDLSLTQESYENFLHFYIIFDILYLLNLLILVLHKTFAWTTPSLLPKKDHSLITIVIDFLSLAPQLLLLVPLADRSFSFFIPLLRVSSMLRLRHLNFFWKILGRLPENRWKWFVAQYVTIFCLCVHTANCLWRLIESDEDYKLYESTSIPINNSTDWYLYHIYYTVQIFLNIGYGDTFPRNFNEIYLFSAMLLVGQAMTVWLVCYITCFLIHRDYHNLYISYKIKDAIKYIEDTDESTEKLKISQYYSIKEHNNFKYIDSPIDILPFSLKQDIFYDLNCGLLRRSLILKELPDSILKRLSLAMKTVILPSGESIYFQYAVKTCMVCIEDGILEVLNDEDQESPLIFFRNGTILGEIALFFNIPSKATVRAGKNTELRILEKSNFLDIMHRFPEHLKNLQTALNKRLAFVNKPRKTIQKFCLPSLRRLKVKLSNIFVTGDTEFDLDEEYYGLYRLYGEKDELAHLVDKKNGLFNYWKVMSDVGQILFCVLYPYYAVFEKNIPEYLNFFGICADVSCFFDVVFQATTSIKVKGKVVRGVPKIVDQKLNDWKFNMDVFSLFPIEVWSFLFENTTLEKRFFDLFKLNRLLRLHRIPSLFNMLTDEIHISMSWIILNVFVYSTLCTYYSACVLYLNACFGVICNDFSWFYLIPREIYDDIQDSKSALVDSIYFTMTSTFYTGVGDILPKSPSDYCILTFLIMLFLIFKSYWIGQITSFVFLRALCSDFLETTYYMNYLIEVYRIPRNFKNNFYRFFQIDQYFYREKSKLFVQETVPNSMKTLVKISTTKDVWRKIPFFKKADSYFLSLIENSVKSWTLPRNEIVYSYGDPTRRMFVIKKGYCDIFDAENALEKTVGPGSELGLLEMIYCLSKKHTVVTKTDCILFYLDYFVLDNILKLFPKEFSTMESVMFQKELLENVAGLELIEDAYENIETKDPTDKEEKYFINISKKWPHYYEIYRQKLGVFWIFGVFLLPVTVYPDSFALKTWCIIRACFIFLQTVIYTILILEPSFGEDLSWIAWVCQGTLYLDMYVSLHIAYYDRCGTLKVHPLYTARNYLTHAFLLDLIAAVPWQYFLSETDNLAFQSNYCFWSLIKLVQFYKVIKCINYFEETFFEFTIILNVLKFLSFAVLSANILTNVCVINIYQEFNVTSNGLEGQKYFRRPDWMPNKTADLNEMYITSMFTIIDWFTSTGIGRFKPMQIATKIAAIFTTLFGFFVFTLLTSIISKLMLADAEETINFRDNISKLFQFLDKNNINTNLKQKILGHFALIWDRTKGFDIDSKAYTDNYFRDKLLINYHEELFYGVPLLYHFDTSYMKLILSQIQIRHYQKGEVIVNYKDVLSDIYIVSSGQVEIFNKTNEPLCLLGPAAVFGNLRKNVHGLSKVFVTARRNVELWLLNTQSFYNTIKYYPLIVQELENLLRGKPAYLAPVVTSNFFIFSSTKGIMDELESDEEEIDKKASSTTCNDKINNKKWTKFAFKSEHVIFIVLDFFTFISSLINIFLIPFVFVTQEDHYLCYLYLCLEPVYYIRIFFKLHQSYTNLYGNVIKSHRKLCKKYLNTPGQCVWDIVPNLPVTLICFCFGQEEQFFSYTCLRLFHLLRFYYVVEYFQKNIDRLLRKNWWYFVRIVVYFMILIHILACIWFMIACPFNKCITGTWISHFRKEISQEPATYKMILSYYYVLTLVTTTGIGDIPSTLYMEVIFTLIVILGGKIFISVIIGTVLKAFYISEKRHLKFHTQAKLLNSYLKDKNISDYLLDRTSLYLENLWIYQQGTLDRGILHSLSYPLQQYLMSTLYGNQLGETFLFKGIDSSLLHQICTKIKRTIYFKDDYIVKSGDVSTTMYFINTGKVLVLTKHPQLTETKHIVLEPMDLFGVCQGLNLEECHNFYYRTATPMVEILSLKYEDWSYLLDFFPRDKLQMFARVNKEYKKIKDEH